MAGNDAGKGSTDPPAILRYVFNIGLLFIVYFILAKIGLSVNAVKFGRQLWPGIFLGAFFVN